MSTTLALLAIVCNLAGAVFLFAAALGLLRFKDPLLRMHASTKAGTIGAGFILAATLLTVDSLEGLVVGLLAIGLLLLTVPVAGHLLGRATYISGAELIGIDDTDALKGILERRTEKTDK